jgi:hypothetical protein
MTFGRRFEAAIGGMGAASLAVVMNMAQGLAVSFEDVRRLALGGMSRDAARSAPKRLGD